jgi:hypothetical protein
MITQAEAATRICRMVLGVGWVLGGTVRAARVVTAEKIWAATPA